MWVKAVDVSASAMTSSGITAGRILLAEGAEGTQEGTHPFMGSVPLCGTLAVCVPFTTC